MITPIYTDTIIINNQELNKKEIAQRLSQSISNEWESKIYRFILDWFADNDYIVQKTSGSTGKPKEIQLKKSAMITSARATISFFHLQPRNTAWLCLPVDYIAGKMMVVRAIIGNLNLLIAEPAGLPQIPAVKVDFASMVPMQVKNLIDKESDFSSISKLLVGGATVDYPLQRELQNITTEVYATYGMTETCSHIALQQINGINPDNYFKTLEGITVETNNLGCLTISAPALLESPLQTTDIVEIKSTTEFKWLGRADNVINSGGIKISPEEIEAIITPSIGIECIISQKIDKILGSKAVLVLQCNSSEIDNSSLLKNITVLTGKLKAPKEIIFIEKFPLNTSLKIDRKQVEQLINNTNQNLFK
jgi:o-succinylbenzoate---CoA ligase